MAVPLCVECSMCCNGSIFSRVPVSAEEQARLPNGRFFTKADGALRMRLGCNFLGEDGSCAVYDKRPKTCATYACRLLRRVNEGKIDDGSARNIVSSFKSYVAKAKEACARAAGEDRAKALEGKDADAAYAQLRVWRDEGVKIDPIKQDEARFHLHVLHEFIRLHFKSSYRKSS